MYQSNCKYFCTSCGHEDYTYLTLENFLKYKSRFRCTKCSKYVKMTRLGMYDKQEHQKIKEVVKQVPLEEKRNYYQYECNSCNFVGFSYLSEKERKKIGKKMTCEKCEKPVILSDEIYHHLPVWTVDEKSLGNVKASGGSGGIGGEYKELVGITPTDYNELTRKLHNFLDDLMLTIHEMDNKISRIEKGIKELRDLREEPYE